MDIINQGIYKFAFRSYQRRFRQPLQTSHGIWELREGIILYLTDNWGKVGWGEIAPLAWFGSETLTAAWEFCIHLQGEITQEVISAIPLDLPACQFGFESALEGLNLSEGVRELGRNSSDYSHLLPAGEAVLNQWQRIWQEGGRTFKWKIGVGCIEEEIRIFEQLTQILPATAKLRLDANGGLNLAQAKKWLAIADKIGTVEFLEQPLPPQHFDLMLELSANYSTPLALDESVANLVQLEKCYEKGWRGIFVIKAAIAGSPQRLRQFCQQYQIDAVFSSVFETNIGREAVLKLARELSHPNRAVGFGVNHWFDESETPVGLSPTT